MYYQGDTHCSGVKKDDKSPRQRTHSDRKTPFFPIYARKKIEDKRRKRIGHGDDNGHTDNRDFRKPAHGRMPRYYERTDSDEHRSSRKGNRIPVPAEHLPAIGIFINGTFEHENRIIVPHSENKGRENDVHDIEIYRKQFHYAENPNPAYEQRQERRQRKLYPAERHEEENKDEQGTDIEHLVEIPRKCVHKASHQGTAVENETPAVRQTGSHHVLYLLHPPLRDIQHRHDHGFSRPDKIIRRRAFGYYRKESGLLRLVTALDYFPESFESPFYETLPDGQGIHEAAEFPAIFVHKGIPGVYPFPLEGKRRQQPSYA